MTYVLGVDLGDTQVVAAVHEKGGQAEVVALSPTVGLPTVAAITHDGDIVVGGDALEDDDAFATVVHGFVDRIGQEEPITLGNHEIRADEMVGALLEQVIEIIAGRMGGTPEELVITAPAGWGAAEQKGLARAASLAGVESAFRVVPAVAAAARYHIAFGELDPASTIMVLDIGAARAQAAVVTGQDESLQLPGTALSAYAGGDDLDALLLNRMRVAHGVNAPGDSEDVRRGVRQVREQSTSMLEVTLPELLSGPKPITLARHEIESAVEPGFLDLRDLISRALATTEIEADELDAVVLSGGVGRMPAVAALASDATGAPAAIALHPEFAPAIGAVLIEVPLHRRPAILAPEMAKTSLLPIPTVTAPPPLIGAGRAGTAVIQDDGRRRVSAWLIGLGAAGALSVTLGLSTLTGGGTEPAQATTDVASRVEARTTETTTATVTVDVEAVDDETVDDETADDGTADDDSAELALPAETEIPTSVSPTTTAPEQSITIPSPTSTDTSTTTPGPSTTEPTTTTVAQGTSSTTTTTVPSTTVRPTTTTTVRPTTTTVRPTTTTTTTITLGPAGTTTTTTRPTTTTTVRPTTTTTAAPTTTTTAAPTTTTTEAPTTTTTAAPTTTTTEAPTTTTTTEPPATTTTTTVITLGPAGTTSTTTTVPPTTTTTEPTITTTSTTIHPACVANPDSQGCANQGGPGNDDDS